MRSAKARLVVGFVLIERLFKTVPAPVALASRSDREALATNFSRVTTSVRARRRTSVSSPSAV